MEAHEAMERFERSEELAEARERFGRHAALVVAVLAAMLAISVLAANDTGKEEILNQAKATDAFNELEANSLKKHINGNDATVLKLLTARTPDRQIGAAEAKKLKAAIAAKYGPNEASLLVKARRFEHERDHMENKHRAFELAEAILQIGIVLTSVAILARVRAMLLVALLLGAVGAGFLADGFLLFWTVSLSV
jgi:hypothetical protein